MGFRSIKTKQITDIRVRLPIRGGFSFFSFLFGAHMYISCVLGAAFFGSLIYLLVFCLSKKLITLFWLIRLECGLIIS